MSRVWAVVYPVLLIAALALWAVSMGHAWYNIGAILAVLR